MLRRQVLRLRREMVSAGVVLQALDCAALMKGLVDCGMPGLAWELFEEYKVGVAGRERQRGRGRSHIALSH